MKKIRSTMAAFAVCLAAASTATAGEFDTAVNDMAMYGINRANGKLMRYDFSSNEMTTVGIITNSQGTVLQGINGSAHIPGFHNIFGFWNDPSDGLTKLVYIDPKNAHAAVVGADLGIGNVMGAVAADYTAAGETNKVVYIVDYVEKITTGELAIEGAININPNNSPHNEFILRKPDNSEITRDDLHQDSNVDGDGTFYTGDSTYVLVKPKGNGNQNGLIVNGQPYVLQNGTTYVFTGDMSCRIYNDHIQNGKAMGNWWISIETDNVLINGDGADVPEVEIVNRLLKLDHKTGIVEHMMTLDRPYTGLASADGNVFYATNDDKLYRINRTNGTESLVATLASDNVHGLEFAGGNLMCFEVDGDTLTPVDAVDGAALAGSMTDPNMKDLGSLLFMPLEDDPSEVLVGYD